MNTHQDIDFESSNSCVRSFNRIFCDWGQTKTPYDQNGNTKSKTAPLWANPSKMFFLALFAISLICSILFCLSFIIVKYYGNKNYDDDEKACIEDSKKDFKNSFIIIGAVILFVNCLMFCFIYSTEYASDKEWSRYLILLTFFWLCMVGFNIAQYIVTSKSLKNFNDLKKLDVITKKCKRLYRSNLAMNFIVAICSTIIEIIELIKLLIISKLFFLNKYVPHSAICEDEDIIIIE